MGTTLVVGTDGSEASNAAVAEAIDLARRLDAKMIVAAVRPPVPDYLGEPLYQERQTEQALGSASA
ncbi:MAG: hypothetical protein QOI67_62 [Gaiellaceae bacterium]|jgi:nucleotide-binding universal stress UspA family protein|nr:hypothetical protein [Gaiellaceae bacterium]